jgi:hypothetical protein
MYSHAISSVVKLPFSDRHLAAEYDNNLAILWSLLVSEDGNA